MPRLDKYSADRTTSVIIDTATREKSKEGEQLGREAGFPCISVGSPLYCSEPCFGITFKLVFNSFFLVNLIKLVFQSLDLLQQKSEGRLYRLSG